MAASSATPDAGRRAAIVGGLLIVIGLLLAWLVGDRLGTVGGTAAPPTGGPIVEVPGGWRPVAWSPDGSQLLVRSETGFAVVAAGGAGPHLAGVAAVAWRPGTDASLAVIRTGSDGQAGLSIVGPEAGDGEGSTTTPLPTGPASALDWAAGGKAWAAGGPDGVTVGWPTGPLPIQGLGPPLALAPDGSALAARDIGGALEIVRLPGRTGDAPTGLHVGADAVLRWSADGSWLAATADGLAGQGLYLLPADGAAPPTLVLPGAGTSPGDAAWSPGAPLLAAVHGGQVTILSVEDGHVARHDLGPGSAVAWRPDGEQLLAVADGRVVELDPSGGLPPKPLADDADASCPPLSSVHNALAYCTSAGALRVMGRP
jgi:hypothetical protein